jgi:UPF0716 protein FxsA
VWIFLLFLLVPLIEIGLFIQVGGLIGLWPTLAIVVLTAIAGTMMVRRQGFRVLNEMRGSFEQLSDPTEPLAHGAMILFSGALLLTPGFFTDAVGFALLVPAVRAAVWSAIRARVVVTGMSYGSGTTQRGPRGNGRHGPDVIETEYHEVDPKTDASDKPASGPSGWTRH